MFEAKNNNNKESFEYFEYYTAQVAEAAKYGFELLFHAPYQPTLAT